MTDCGQHGTNGDSRRFTSRRHGLLLLLASLAAGALSAGAFGVSDPAAPASVLAIISPLLCILRPARRFLLPLLVLSLFSYGNYRVASLLTVERAGSGISRLSGQRLQVEGMVADRPEQGPDGFRFTLDVGTVGTDRVMTPEVGRILVQGEGDAGGIGRGDLVRLTGRVRTPRPLGLPGEFDYGRFLALQGVGGTIFLRDGESVEPVAPMVDRRLRRWIDDMAAEGGRIIEGAVGGSEGEILKALLTGERRGIPDKTEEIYARAGVSHLLSISGFHVGVLALVMVQLLLLLARRSERLLLSVNVRRLLPLATLPVIVFYLLLSGGAVATVRSVIMAVVCALILLADREIDPLHSLFLAALLILVAAPHAIYDISFQLSFMALWGIMLTAPLLEGPVSRIPSPPLRWLSALVVASTAATLATLAAVAWHFNRGSLAGIVANIVAVPLVGYGGVAVGFAGLLLHPVIPTFGDVLLQAAAWLVRLSDMVMQRAAAIPPIRWTAEWHDVLAAAVLLAALSLQVPLRRRLAILACLLAAWGGAGLLHRPDRDGTLAVHFLSVGQGDAALVRTPSGETVLIDGGGLPGPRGVRFGRRTLVPALERLGVHRIDRLVLSHPHPDHMGGLPAVVDRFPVAEFWYPSAADHPLEMRLLIRQVAASGGVLRPLSSASPVATLGGCEFRILAPLAARSGDWNEDSLVLRLSWKGWHLLFAGDIGADTEARLLSSGTPLAAQVLKVPHHGSRYSSSAPFLAAVSPREAVISAGFGNIYGLPASESVARLQRQGARVHRTDLDGTVTVICRPEGGEVRRHGRGAGLASHFPIDTP